MSTHDQLIFSADFISLNTSRRLQLLPRLCVVSGQRDSATGKMRPHSNIHRGVASPMIMPRYGDWIQS